MLLIDISTSFSGSVGEGGGNDRGQVLVLQRGSRNNAVNHAVASTGVRAFSTLFIKPFEKVLRLLDPHFLSKLLHY